VYWPKAGEVFEIIGEDGAEKDEETPAAPYILQGFAHKMNNLQKENLDPLVATPRITKMNVNARTAAKEDEASRTAEKKAASRTDPTGKDLP